MGSGLKVCAIHPTQNIGGKYPPLDSLCCVLSAHLTRLLARGGEPATDYVPSREATHLNCTEQTTNHY